MAAKTKEQKRTNEEYQELYGYTLDEMLNKYKTITDEAQNNPQLLADLNYIQLFSDKFETPMYNHIERNAILAMIQNYIQNDRGADENETNTLHDERIDEMNGYLNNSGKLYTVIDKRATDWIVRQQKVTRQIQEAIIIMLEAVYKYATGEAKKKLASETTEILQAKLHSAGIRYKESQLDLITLKATQELLPMFEMELFKKKYEQNIQGLMAKWNEQNKKYYMLTGDSIGAYRLNSLDIADKLYRTKYNLLKSNFYKNIDGYSGEFLNNQTFRRSIFSVGDVYAKHK